MGIVGSRVGDTNMRYRYLFIAFASIAAFAVIVSWRGQLMMNSEYQEVSTHRITSKSVAKKQPPVNQLSPTLNQELNQ